MDIDKPLLEFTNCNKYFLSISNIFYTFVWNVTLKIKTSIILLATIWFINIKNQFNIRLELNH